MVPAEVAPGSDRDRVTALPPFSMKSTSLKNVLLSELGTLRSCEAQLLAAMPAAIEESVSRALREALRQLQREVRQQLVRLDQVLENNPSEEERPECPVTEVLLASMDALWSESPATFMRDVEVVWLFHRLHSNAISGYTAVVAHLRQTGDGEALDEMNLSLAEKEDALTTLTDLAAEILSFCEDEEPVLAWS